MQGLYCVNSLVVVPGAYLVLAPSNECTDNPYTNEGQDVLRLLSAPRQASIKEIDHEMDLIHSSHPHGYHHYD